MIKRYQLLQDGCILDTKYDTKYTVSKREKADTLFKQIEDENEKTVKLIAEATYQRGKIAGDAIQYLDALKHWI